MKLTWKLTVMMPLAAGLAWAGHVLPEGAVPVCLHQTADNATMYSARFAASKMFATAGVTIDWRKPGSCPAGSIVVSLLESASDSDHPRALAYALPYEGMHVVVFYKRLQSMTKVVAPDLLPMLLAHVLVHEITHILQGACRHSETGIMKAAWDIQDFRQMQTKSLSFTETDIDLLQRGLRNRNAALLAGNRSPAAAR